MIGISQRLIIYTLLNNYFGIAKQLRNIEVPGAKWRESKVSALKYASDICDKHDICKNCELFTVHYRDFCYIRLVVNED